MLFFQSSFSLNRATSASLASWVASVTSSALSAFDTIFFSFLKLLRIIYSTDRVCAYISSVEVVEVIWVVEAIKHFFNSTFCRRCQQHVEDVIVALVLALTTSPLAKIYVLHLCPSLMVRPQRPKSNKWLNVHSVTILAK